MKKIFKNKATPTVGDKVYLRRSHTHKTDKVNFKYNSTDELILLKKTIIGGYFDDDFSEEAKLKDEKTGNTFTVSSSKISLNPKDFPYEEVIVRTLGSILFIGMLFAIVVSLVNA